MPPKNRSFNRLRPLITAGLAILSLTTSAIASEKTETFAKSSSPLSWVDTENHTHSFSDAAKSKATVFFFSSAQCPVSNIYSPRMLALATSRELLETERAVAKWRIDAWGLTDTARGIISGAERALLQS